MYNHPPQNVNRNWIFWVILGSNTKGGENEVFKLARAREGGTRDLGSVRCIKDEDGRVLVEDGEVRERWKDYFCKFFNEEGLDVS